MYLPYALGMAPQLPVGSLPEVPGGERRTSVWAAWPLRIAAATVIAISVALAWQAHRLLSAARDPVDTTTATLASTAVMYSLTAAIFLGVGAWALLGARSRSGWLVSVAAPATTVAVLPWSAVAGWGIAVNVVAGAVAVASWLMAWGGSNARRRTRRWPSRVR